MLGVPCSPSAGLEQIDGEQTRRLLDIQVKSGNSTHRHENLAAVCRDGLRLTLVGWQVAELVNAIPEELREVVAQLRSAETAFECDTHERVEVWRPSAVDWDRIQAAVEFSDRELIRSWMWKSIARSTVSLKQFEKVMTPEKVDYGTAREELLRAINRARQFGLHTEEVTAKLKVLNRAFDKTIVDAIIRDAMSASDSIGRSLLLAAAKLMEHWHHSSELILSAKPSHDGRLHKRDDVLQPEEIGERLTIKPRRWQKRMILRPIWERSTAD